MGRFLLMRYCFPYCFLEIFVGGTRLCGGVQSHEMEDPPSLPTRENPDVTPLACTQNTYFSSQKLDHAISCFACFTVFCLIHFSGFPDISSFFLKVFHEKG